MLEHLNRLSLQVLILVASNVVPGAHAGFFSVTSRGFGYLTGSERDRKLTGEAAKNFIESLRTKDLSPPADELPYVRLLNDVCWGQLYDRHAIRLPFQNRALYTFGSNHRSIAWPRQNHVLRLYKTQPHLRYPRVIVRPFSGTMPTQVHVIDGHAALLYAGGDTMPSVLHKRPYI